MTRRGAERTEAMQLSSATYYARNREKVIAKSHEWGTANKEKRKAIDAKYRAENREKQTLGHAKWRAKHPEKVKEQNARKYAKNPQKRRFFAARWAAENPDKACAKVNRRRARLNGCPQHYTDLELSDLRKKCGDICAHCGTSSRITIDHITPLSRGGSNVISNIQFLCLPCNSSKGARNDKKIFERP